MDKPFTTTEIYDVMKAYKNLLSVCKFRNYTERKMVEFAFSLAFTAHEYQRRKSGEPYIHHPIEVAQIVAQEMSLDANAVVCALLHDVVEDTEYTLEQMVSVFGHEKASILDGLTKIEDIYNSKDELQVINFKKMLITIPKNINVVLIKIADRLHNMRTMENMAEHKRRKKSSETLHVYSPLAHRLGYYLIKKELEDLAFKYLHPQKYEETVNSIAKKASSREKLMITFKKIISQKLEENDVKYTIISEQNSVYSIFKKMRDKNIPFSKIYNYSSARVVFCPNGERNERSQCNSVYSLMTDVFYPVPQRLRDFTVTPKSNGFEAILLDLMVDGKKFESQILSTRMQDVASRGIGAMKKYSEFYEENNNIQKWIDSIDEHLSNKEMPGHEMMDVIQYKLFASEIYVFTPKGKIVNLPKNSCIIDMAYDIHSDLGFHCSGAYVNGKLVSRFHVLTNGDQAKILTEESVQPGKNWLSYIKTARAKTKLKFFFRTERKLSIEYGKKLFEKITKNIDIEIIQQKFDHFKNAIRCKTKDDVFLNIGREVIKQEDILRIFRPKFVDKITNIFKRKTEDEEKIKPEDEGFEIQKIVPKDPYYIGHKLFKRNYVLAKCCHPISGQDAIAYQSSEGKVLIHTAVCSFAIMLGASQSRKVAKVTWIPQEFENHLITIELRGIDRKKMVIDIAHVISMDLNINMQGLEIFSTEGIFKGTINLYVRDDKDLDTLITLLRKIEGMKSVIRVSSQSSEYFTDEV